MGLEAQCTVRVGRKSSKGKALFEGDALVFRGNLRLDIATERILEVLVAGDELVVRTDDQEAHFELGAQVAEKWQRAIQEPKGLLEKLEVGPTSRLALVGVTDVPFLNAVRQHAAVVIEGRAPEGASTIFLGTETRDALEKIPLLRARMTENGALWIIRPKGSKAISESDVLGALRGAGLVDIKVVAFSRTHTAHKSVIPLELRGKAIPRPPIVSLPPGPRRGAKIETNPEAEAEIAAPKATKKKNR